jgi:hypothetical protein
MTLITEQREDGKAIGVAGASRSGKTYHVKQKIIAQHQRVLTFDLRSEYGDCGLTPVRSLRELNQISRQAGAGRYRFVPKGNPIRAFDYFCQVAYDWLHLFPGTVVADELAQLTTSGKAVDGWGNLLRLGKHWGAWVVGITQSPTESDKTLWKNADRFVCFRVEGEDERAYMARLMNIPADRLPTAPHVGVARNAGSDTIETV